MGVILTLVFILTLMLILTLMGVNIYGRNFNTWCEAPGR